MQQNGPAIAQRLILSCGVLLACLSVSPLLAQDPPPPRNPIGQMFRQLNKEIHKGAEALEWEKSGRDQLDVRPLQRPEDGRHLARAESLIRDGRWHEATEVLQYLLNRPTDSFRMTKDRQLRSLQGEANRLLQSLPEEGQRTYLSRYTAPANALFAEAENAQSEDQLIEVVRLYFQTPAGRSALRLLARLWEDRGNWGRAEQAWQRLAATASGSERTDNAMKAVRLLAREGRIDDARELAATFSIPEPLSLPSPESLAKRDDQERVSPFLPEANVVQVTETPRVTLLPRWSKPLIERYSVNEQLNVLIRDLREQGRALIPTVQPLVVSDKLAYRTLRSLQVRDIASGEILWERRSSDSPEEFMTQTGESTFGGTSARSLRYYQETLFEHHQLASLIYRDLVYAGLSSDGQHLFAVESSGAAAIMSPIHAWQRRTEATAESVPWQTNELTAYDLNTGRVRWRIGGRKIEDQFSPPLAGTYFFGPPVPDGDRLLVIGERNAEVSLFCLESESGLLIWSQGLAMPGRPVSEDTVRRYWACRPVIAGGVILCPTTCGWMVAVDRTTRQLRWANRYAPRLDQHRQFRGGFAVQSLQELNRRWQELAPRVSGGRVVVTPPEIPDEFGMAQPLICCLDVETGEMLWQQPKENHSASSGLYVLGIWNEQIIIVGRHAVYARELNGTGDILWSVRLPGVPSGRAVIVNNEAWIPVGGDSLVTVNLNDHELLTQMPLATSQGDLGNLVLAKESVLSVSPQSVMNLPARSGPAATVKDPLQSVQKNLREAQLLMAAETFAEVVPLLDDPVWNDPSLSDELKQRARDLKWKALVAMTTETLGSGPASDTLERLNKLAETSDEQQTLQRLQGQQLIAQGDWTAGVQHLINLLAETRPETVVSDGSRTVRIDCWIGGQLRDVWLGLPQDDQSRFTAPLGAAIEQIPNDPVVRDHWARALMFHPLGQQLELDLAGHAWSAGDKANALLRLRRAADGPNRDLQIEALTRLAKSYSELGWHADSVNAAQELASLARSAGEAEASLKAAESGIALSRKATEQTRQHALKWEGTWKLERTALIGDEAGFASVTTIGHGAEAVRKLRLMSRPDRNRLRIEDEVTGRFQGSFPLRSVAALAHNPNVGARLLGPYVFVLNQGVVHAVSVADDGILWSWSPDLKGLAINRLSAIYDNTNHVMLNAMQFSATRQLHVRRSQTGFLLAANERALLLLCRDWVAIDPITGEELWRDSAAPARATAASWGPGRFLTSEQSQHQVRHVLDGAITKTPETHFEHVFGETDGDLIVLHRPSRSEKRPQVLPDGQVQRLSADGQTLWSKEIPADALLGQPDSDSLFWLDTENELTRLDFPSGESKSLGKLPVPESDETQRNVALLADEERTYVFVERHETRHSFINMPTLRFTGLVIAFNQQGDRLWTYETPEDQPSTDDDTSPKKTAQESGPQWQLHVALDDFRENPLLVLLGDKRPERIGDLYVHRLRVIGLDKTTGRPVIDWQRPSESGGFTFLHVDSTDRRIEVRTYHERLLLTTQAKRSQAPEPPE